MAVEINKSIQHRFEHIASFGSRESALGKNLGEVFFGILHHDIEAVPVLNAATADVEDAKQIGMSELHNAEPQRDLEIGGGSSSDEFDYGFLRLRGSELREEDGGVVRTA
jgi:hypothetical protein